MSGEWWSIMTIVGPILFGIVLIWVITHNRRSRRDEARSEAATRDLREEMTAERQAHDQP